MEWSPVRVGWRESVGCAAELQIGSPRLMWRATVFLEVIDMQIASAAVVACFRVVPALLSRRLVNTIMEMRNGFLCCRLFELDNKVVQ